VFRKTAHRKLSDKCSSAAIVCKHYCNIEVDDCEGQWVAIVVRRFSVLYGDLEKDLKLLIGDSTEWKI